MVFTKFKLLAQILRAVIIAAREKFTRLAFERVPEPSLVMNEVSNVEAYHQAGFAEGGMLPAYHFNALAISALTPLGATVLDLGSGSAQMICYLARLRPDIKIYGLDLSDAMIDQGLKLIAELSLQNRVWLQKGDMTQFADHFRPDVETISSVFALHHLPDRRALNTCMQEVLTMQKKHNCSVWLFDLNRPRNLRTALEYPNVFLPKATIELQEDTINSLIAAFSIAEMSEALVSSEGFCHSHSRLLELYQIHWKQTAFFDNKQLFVQNTLSASELNQFKALNLIFPRILKNLTP